MEKEEAPNSDSDCNKEAEVESMDRVASDNEEDTKDCDNNAEAFSAMSLERKGPIVVVLPFCVVPYKDHELFEYIHLDILLLSGTTMNSMIYNMEKCGCCFTAKHVSPEFWMTSDMCINRKTSSLLIIST